MIFYRFYQRNFCFLTETGTLQLAFFLAWRSDLKQCSYTVSFKLHQARNLAFKIGRESKGAYLVRSIEIFVGSRLESFVDEREVLSRRESIPKGK